MPINLGVVCFRRHWRRLLIFYSIRGSFPTFHPAGGNFQRVTIMTTQFNYSFAFLSRLAIDFDIKVSPARVTTLFSKLIFIAERNRNRKSHAKRCSPDKMLWSYRFIYFRPWRRKIVNQTESLRRYSVKWTSKQSHRSSSHASLVAWWRKNSVRLFAGEVEALFVDFSHLSHEKTHRFAFFCLVCPFFWKLSEYPPGRHAITLPNVGSNPSLITYHRNSSRTVTCCRWSCSANIAAARHQPKSYRRWTSAVSSSFLTLEKLRRKSGALRV